MKNMDSGGLGHGIPQCVTEEWRTLSSLSTNLSLLPLEYVMYFPFMNIWVDHGKSTMGNKNTFQIALEKENNGRVILFPLNINQNFLILFVSSTYCPALELPLTREKISRMSFYRLCGFSSHNGNRINMNTHNDFQLCSISLRSWGTLGLVPLPCRCHIHFSVTSHVSLFCCLALMLEADSLVHLESSACSKQQGWKCIFCSSLRGIKVHQGLGVVGPEKG